VTTTEKGGEGRKEREPTLSASVTISGEKKRRHLGRRREGSSASILNEEKEGREKVPNQPLEHTRKKGKNSFW